MTQQTIVSLTVTMFFAGMSVAQPPMDLPPNQAPATGDAPAAPIAALPSNDVGAPGRLWFTADYLHGWMQPAHLPPLVTTSPQGTARTSAGVLGLPTTSLLFDCHVNDDP